MAARSAAASSPRLDDGARTSARILSTSSGTGPSTEACAGSSSRASKSWTAVGGPETSAKTCTGGNRFSLLFTVDNKPGKLGEVIQIIGASGFNMESIKSRPMPHVPFEYYFYVELVGDPTADETAALLRELDRTCRTVRLLGVYTK